MSQTSSSPGEIGFSIGRIPVVIQPWFWLIAVMLGLDFARGPGGGVDPVRMLAWVAIVLISILIHELGHANMARLFGFSPAITLHGMGGLTSYDPRTFGPEGVRPRVRIPIILAGPGAGFLLAALIYLALLVSGHHPRVVLAGPIPQVYFTDLRPAIFDFFVDGLLFVNIAWGLFNLLPIYPLDGGQLARIVSVLISPREGLRASLILSIVAAVALALLSWQRSHDMWMTILFGYFAYMNFTELQIRSQRSLW